MSLLSEQALAVAKNRLWEFLTLHRDGIVLAIIIFATKQDFTQPKKEQNIQTPPPGFAR
jgi:hypothetical protein